MTTEKIVALICTFVSAGGLAAVSAQGAPLWIIICSGLVAGASAVGGWLGFSKPSDKRKLKGVLGLCLALSLGLTASGCSTACRMASKGIEAAALTGSAPQCDDECKEKALKAIDSFEWLGERSCETP